MEKLLTVSVASYNVEKTLAQALDSFLAPEILARVEVLIIDDGATDGTGDLARGYVEKYPETFRFVHKENGGYGSTINTSLPLATGRYFRLLDGDDWFDAEALTAFLDALEGLGEDVVVTTGYTERHEDTGARREQRLDVSPGGGRGFEALEGQLYVAHHQTTFRTDCLRRDWQPMLEHCFYTDDLFLLQGFLSAETLAVVVGSPYQYRLAFAGQSVSREGFARHYAEGIRCDEEMNRRFRAARVPDGPKRDFLIGFLAHHIQGVVGMLLSLTPSRKNKGRLRSFMDLRRQETPEVYKACRAKKVLLLRYSRFWLYRPLAWVWQRGK